MNPLNLQSHATSDRSEQKKGALHNVQLVNSKHQAATLTDNLRRQGLSVKLLERRVRADNRMAYVWIVVSRERRTLSQEPAR